MTTPTVTPVTISNGTALSPAIPLAPRHLTGIAVPSTWNAANLSLQASYDGTNFFEFCDKAGLYAIVVPAVAGYVIGLDPAVFRGVVMIKIRSGTLASPVNQTGDQILQVITTPLT